MFIVSGPHSHVLTNKAILKLGTPLHVFSEHGPAHLPDWASTSSRTLSNIGSLLAIIIKHQHIEISKH